jgi:predicted amidohydrolase YtcJ
MNAQLIEPRIGSERNNQQYQLHSLQNSGARISYGSDWPVTSHLPLQALGVPTHRSAPGSNDSWSPEEAISIEDSIVHYTEDAAYQNFWNKGIIEVGADADFIILDRNPIATPADQIATIAILDVYVAGEQVQIK